MVKRHIEAVLLLFYNTYLVWYWLSEKCEENTNKRQLSLTLNVTSRSATEAKQHENVVTKRSEKMRREYQTTENKRQLSLTLNVTSKIGNGSEAARERSNETFRDHRPHNFFGPYTIKPANDAQQRSFAHYHSFKQALTMDASHSMPSSNHPRGRCVSLEENLDDVGVVILAAQANDASLEEEDGSVLGRGDEFSYLSSIYRPRRTVSDASHGSASAADQVMSMSSTKKRRSSSNLDEITMAPPKKISRKKIHRRITDFHGDGLNHSTDTINPTHLMFNQSPKAPKKVSRTKRRVLCSAIGCSNTSFHNGGMCFNHGGNRTINPINLFSVHQAQPCASGDED